MQDIYVYENESNTTAFLAGAIGATTEMLEGIIGWEPFEQGNGIETDLFFLGKNHDISIEEAMKKRFRDVWYMKTDLSKQAQERIVESFKLDLEVLEMTFEEAVTEVIFNLMKLSYRERIGEYQKYIHQYCEEVEYCFGMHNIKNIYGTKRNSNFRLMEENYSFIYFRIIFVEFEDGHVLMLMPTNYE